VDAQVLVGFILGFYTGLFACLAIVR